MLVPVSTRMVRSQDGTSVRAWCNDGSGIPVLLCNGLGAPPAAWPRVIAQDSGYRVVSWSQRGLHGSERPADRQRVRVEDHVDDARAVLDAFGLGRVTLVGWSLGVNVAFELALEDPERVAGVMAVAGIPGGSFASMFATHGVPRALRPRAGRVSSWLLPVVGPLTPLAAATLPSSENSRSAAALRAVAKEFAHLGTLGAVVREFSHHDWRWYRHLAVGVADHPPMDVSAVACPVSFLAGSFDSLVDVKDMRRVAHSIPGARYRELRGTHFLPLQYPDVMLEELRRLSVRPA
jgi:pimeloyl-ACP methyl ester carboxylesterase